MWTHEIECLRPGQVQRIAVSSNGIPLPFGDALHLLDRDASFREYLTQLLAGSAYGAYRWETPPISLSSLGRPFEFVLTNDPTLETQPEPGAFVSYFTGAEAAAAVLPIPNLGKTALLIVPRQLGKPGSYTHFARFLRFAPADQVHALWRCIATNAQYRLSPARQWISTAGGGVAWLHVRIEQSPKYYAYRPYANAV